jgi:hypothetical protein
VTGEVADANGHKPAEDLICGGVADRAEGSDRKTTCRLRGDGPESTRAILDALAGYGASVVVNGDQTKLVMSVGKALPADVIDAAREHQDELRALAGKVEPLPPVIVWSREDSQAFYDKVTGTLLSEGLSKPKAEAFAFEFHRMAKSHIRAVTTWALRPLRSRRV